MPVDISSWIENAYCSLAELIGLACAQDSDIAESVTRSFFSVYSELLVIRRSREARRAISTDATRSQATGFHLWKALGTLISPGIKAHDWEQNSLYNLSDRRDVRCSWLQCPLHENTGILLTREIMLCVGCHEVRPHRLVTWITHHFFPHRFNIAVSSVRGSTLSLVHGLVPRMLKLSRRDWLNGGHRQECAGTRGRNGKC